MPRIIPVGYRQYKTYKTRAKAQSAATKLRKSGRAVSTREVAIKGKGIRYRIFVKVGR